MAGFKIHLVTLFILLIYMLGTMISPVSSKNKTANGDVCSKDKDCASGFCNKDVSPLICQECINNNDCKGTKLCRSGSCVQVACFSGDDKVRLSDGELKSMRDLQVGDRIWSLCDDGRESQCLTHVIRIPHAEPDISFLFYTVETATGHRLSLSDNHYIRVYQHGYLSGDELMLNHSLYVVNLNGSMSLASIIQIKRQVRVGVYQPVTLTGTLLVNGIVASSYLNNLKLSHEQLHDILAPLRWWYHIMRPFGGLINQSTINKRFVHWLQKRLIWNRDILPLVCRIFGGLLAILLSAKLMIFMK